MTSQFVGDKCKCEVAGLEPNNLYHFRLRYVGSRNNSQLSQPLVLMSVPLPPSAPVLIRKGSKNAWIKWYSPANGAFRFLVQLKTETPSSSSITSGTSSSRPSTVIGGWSNVFNGPETSWKSTTLIPDTNYMLRVVGVNCQGNMGEPSPILRFRTLPRDHKETLSARSAATDFVIECTGDICVGDTILITERLFEKTNSLNTNKHMDVTGVRRSNTGTGAGSMNKSTVRMDMSVTSLGSAVGASVAGPPLGAYIGERTIAAHVVRDNYRTLKKGKEGFISFGTSKFARSRRLMLEVVWQRASSDACKPYELKSGVTVERHQTALEQFEVFRCRWEQEEGRMPLKREWPSMADCFVDLRC